MAVEKVFLRLLKPKRAGHSLKVYLIPHKHTQKLIVCPELVQRNDIEVYYSLKI